MASERHLDDATSTAGSRSSLTIVDNWDGDNIYSVPWDGDNFFSVPWPGSVYVILEKASCHTITLRNGSLSLSELDLDGKQDEYSYWLCVEDNGYFGFFNTKSGKYIGHDGEWDMQATAVHSKDWKYLITPRRHPDGGYQLLTPLWQHTHTLMEVAVADDGKSLVRRQHGTTLWMFIKI